MLEDRPILQKTLIGAGAFSFVFTAAMAGSAFMISGGFGFGGDNPRPASIPDYVTVTEAAWSEWATPDAYAATASYTPAPADHFEGAEAPVYAPAEDLDGDARAARYDEVDDRSSEEILREIEREFPGLYEAAEADIAQSAEADAYSAPAPHYAPTQSYGYDPKAQANAASSY